MKAIFQVGRAPFLGVVVLIDTHKQATPLQKVRFGSRELPAVVPYVVLPYVLRSVQWP
jgi:hypothetical protein